MAKWETGKEHGGLFVVDVFTSNQYRESTLLGANLTDESPVVCAVCRK